MNNFKKISLALSFAACAIAGNANANTVSTTVNILDSDPGSVQYVNFSVLTGGAFSISAQGFDSLGVGYNSDPEIHLFSNSLSIANLLGSDDDGAGNLDSLLNINLGIGSYILAVSEFFLEASEAVSGINAGSVGDPGLIQIGISSQDGVVQLPGQVPEPASLALVGLALAGLSAARRRNAK